MPCPCVGDGNIADDREHVYLRFIGGKDKIGRLRGRWRTYETGRIYRRFPANANFNAYPYWDPATEKEFCDQEAARAKASEAVEADAVLPDEAIEEVFYEPPTTTETSTGLGSEFSGGVNEADLIKGMDDQLLKNYIKSNGGKVDGRWGRDKLIQEALTL